MGKIIQFKSRPDRKASRNVADFVFLCRHDLTVFGADLDWDADSWKLSDYIQIPGKRNGGKIVVHWTSIDTKPKKPGMLLKQPFRDFAKAYLRYQNGLRLMKHHPCMTPMRALERTLIESYGSAEIEKVNPFILDKTVAFMSGWLKQSTLYNMANELERLSVFLVKNNMTRVKFMWVPAVVCPEPAHMVGRDYDQKRAEKMPDRKVIEALAIAFNISVAPVDVLVSSTAALMCCTPDRINEVMLLRKQCAVKETDPNTRELTAYGISFKSLAKGADPRIKWVPSVWVEIAQRALGNIIEQTSAGRILAKWYEKFPDKMYLPRDCHNLRGKEFLTPAEVAKIIGYRCISQAREWARRLGLKAYPNPNSQRPKATMYLYADVEQAVLKMLPKYFPYTDKSNNIKCSDALFVVPYGFFKVNHKGRPCMFELVTSAAIYACLGGNQNRKRVRENSATTLFNHLALTMPDGSPIKIPTHRFRHWINTVAQKGNLSQLQIAIWSGRRNVSQNADYDHRTAEDIRAIARKGDIIGPMKEIIVKTPIGKDEFLDTRFKTAHATEYGICIHDFSMLSCQKHRDCINCGEQIVVKGDSKRNDHLRRVLSLNERLLAEAQDAETAQVYGADRWTEHHALTVNRQKAIVRVLDDAQIPLGTLIQLNTVGDYTLIGLSVQDRIELGDKEGQTLKAIRTRRMIGHKEPTSVAALPENERSAIRNSEVL